MTASDPIGTPAQPEHDPAEWERRRQGNRRLAWGLVGVAVAIFLLALWKYRPL